MRRAVGKDQTVHAELAIVWRIAKITAVSRPRVAVFIIFDPASVRVKLERLDAAASRSGGKPDSVMVVSGIKKQATAKPWPQFIQPRL